MSSPDNEQFILNQLKFCKFLFLKDGSSASTTVIQASPTFNNATPPPSLPGGAHVAVSKSTSLLSINCTPSPSTSTSISEPDELVYGELDIPTQDACMNEVNIFCQY